MRLIIGILFLPFLPLLRWFVGRAEIIEKNKIDDQSILILKGNLNVTKIT